MYTETHTQHKLFKARIHMFYCTSQTLLTLFKSHNDQPTVLITINGFQEARSIKSKFNLFWTEEQISRLFYTGKRVLSIAEIINLGKAHQRLLHSMWVEERKKTTC